MEEMPDGWGILFTLAIMRHEAIYSTTRLNKALSFLQREGFPIENMFKNDKLGPYDAAVHKKAIEFEEDNLILIELIEKEKDDDPDDYQRNNYYLKEGGKQFYLNNIFPTINKSMDRGYKMGITKAKAQLLLKNKELVKSVHDELHLDDPSEYIGVLLQNIEYLEKRLEEAKPNKFCPRDIGLLGASEFICYSLNKIKTSHLPPIDERTGKNHVLFNSERFCNFISHINVGTAHETCKIKGKCMMYKGLSTKCNTEMIYMNHYLRATEYNSGFYGIYQPINPNSYDFTEYD